MLSGFIQGILAMSGHGFLLLIYGKDNPKRPKGIGIAGLLSLAFVGWLFALLFLFAGKRDKAEDLWIALLYVIAFVALITIWTILARRARKSNQNGQTAVPVVTVTESANTNPVAVEEPKKERIEETVAKAPAFSLSALDEKPVAQGLHYITGADVAFVPSDISDVFVRDVPKDEPLSTNSQPVIRECQPEEKDEGRAKSAADSPLTINTPIRFCRKCGAKLLPNSRFCSQCGIEVITR